MTTPSPAEEAQQRLRDGDTEGALQALQTAVRGAPGNAELRTFLSQLLMVLGDWERALAQLQVSAQLDAANAPMAHTYRLAIAAERVRQAVLTGNRKPPLLGEPAPWMAAWVDAVGTLCASSEHEPRAVEALLAALADAPEVPGTIDGQSFEWLGDADMRFGPMFELIVNGTYYWVPVQQLLALQFEPPQDLRDLVWIPGYAHWRNGGSTPVLMPARYPGAEHADAAHRLGRRSDFEEKHAGFWIGHGQRVLATDSGEHALLEVRHIEFRPDAP